LTKESKRKRMNKLNELFSDGEQLSLMRFLVALIVLIFLTVWAALSLQNGRFYPIDWSVVAVIASALGFKSVQSFAENLGSNSTTTVLPLARLDSTTLGAATQQTGSPSLQADATDGGNVPTVKSAAPLLNPSAAFGRLNSDMKGYPVELHADSVESAKKVLQSMGSNSASQSGCTLPKVLVAIWLGIIALCAGLMLCGCTTSTITTSSDGTSTTNTTLNIPATSNAVYTATYAGTYGTILGLKIAQAAGEDTSDILTNFVAASQLASVAFATVYASGDYSESALTNALATVGCTNEAVVSGIQAGLVLYDALAAQVVQDKLDQVTWLQPCMVAMEKGIYTGLSKAGY
jgi:hypothetical protein